MLSKAQFTVNTADILGSGSFGTIHRAKDKDGRELAAKRIDCNKTRNKASEITKDLKKLIALDHENIARIFEVLEEMSAVWVFMELCNHGDLVDYIQGNKAPNGVSEAEKLKLMLDIAEGVEYLHSKNVIHRDIKPSNILVAGSPATAKLTDFDCSKFLEVPYSTSVMTSNVGTQAFKAPEFYLRTDDNKLEYHRNIDIYALGLTFLAIIQNNRFLVPKIETPNEASEAIITIGLLMWERIKYEVKPLEVVKISPEGSEPDHELWNEVRQEILKMTHVEPNKRPSAKEVVQDLGKVVIRFVNKQEKESTSKSKPRLLVPTMSAADLHKQGPAEANAQVGSDMQTSSQSSLL